MNHRITALFASAAALTLAAGSAFAQTDTPPAAPPAGPPAGAAPAAAAPAAPMPPTLLPSMSASLAVNSSPFAFDLGPGVGKIYVTGALTGLAMNQTNPVPGDRNDQADVDNAQVFINKSDGVLQFFVQAGIYATPSLATPYIKSTTLTQNTYDYVPQAFIKIAPNSSFSIEAGKLPTLIGAEYTFTFENLNVERGLLWNLEPVVSKGVQGNYTQGPVALSVAWTDGYYSNQYNTVSGLLTWTIDPADTLAFAGQGNTQKSNVSTFVTPPALNNGDIFNVIYTHTMGPWTFNPYFQYTSNPSVSKLGISSATSSGVALLVNYAFDSKSMLAGVSLPVRFEYLTATNKGTLLPASSEWSATFTPTYQYKIFFIRGEVSYVSASGGVNGALFGPKGTASTQTRALVETGVLF